jgi:3-methyl-2-oxobutanoate hydroxymethyltransferase
MGVMTIKEFMDLRGKRKVLVSTAHDSYIARICELSGMDLIVTFCKSLTTSEVKVNIAEVRRGAPNTLIAFGLPPFGVWHSQEEILKTAFMAQEAGADIIWCSGLSPDKIKPIADMGLPCGAHIGFVPRHKTWYGGPRGVGKTGGEALNVFQKALSYQEAGVIALEVECLASKVAREITSRLSIHTLSIGSGPDCTGIYLFSIDLLGMHDEHYPRHAKKYGDFFGEGIKAFKKFAAEVKEKKYPGEKNTVDISDGEFAEFMEGIKDIKPVWDSHRVKEL